MAFENPYKAKILTYQDFVLSDEQARQAKSQWNSTIFPKERPLKVEIGSGYGDFMMDYAKTGDHCNFIGIDFRIKRSFFLARKLEILREQNLNHFDFRFLALNAVNIHEYFGQGEISELFYFFPDPWPKKRHHRRRLFQKSFLINLHPLLKNHAFFWIKTDDAPYFEWMKHEMTLTTDLFELSFITEDLYSDKLTNIQCDKAKFLKQHKTRFETLFLEQGKTIKAICLIRK